MHSSHDSIIDEKIEALRREIYNPIPPFKAWVWHSLMNKVKSLCDDEAIKQDTELCIQIRNDLNEINEVNTDMENFIKKSVLSKMNFKNKDERIHFEEALEKLIKKLSSVYTPY